MLYIAGSAGVFFGRANFLLAKAHAEIRKRGENGLVKRSGVGGGECLTPTLRVTM